MKAKDKENILNANRLYLTEDDDSDKKAFEIRIQFPNKTFVVIDLSEPIPDSLNYQSLSPNGFGLSDEERNKVIKMYFKV